MKRSLIGLVVLIPNLSVAEVPNVFTPQTAAKASEVNENFAYLDGISTGNTEGLVSAAAAIDSLLTNVTNNAANISILSESLAASVNTLQDNIDNGLSSLSESTNGNLTVLDGNINSTLARVVAVEDSLLLSLGERNVSVDCSQDPEALLTAYQQNLQYSNVNFILTGDCYGDITNVPSSSNFVQLAGQTVTISSLDANQKANIIPHVDSDKAQLTTGLSGGLYLQNVNITAGDNDTNVLSYSRQSHGDLSGVTVTGNIGVSGMSLVTGQGVSITGDVTISNSTIQLSGTNTVTAAQFSCAGRSTLEISGWSKVNQNDSTIDNSTNCVDSQVWQGVADMYLNSLNQ